MCVWEDEPMRLKYSFEMMELDDRSIAIPVGNSNNEFNGIIKLDGTAEAIFNLLKNDISEEKIVEALEEEYDAPHELISKDVHRVLQMFTEKELLI